MSATLLKPDYGIDAPGLVRFFLLAGLGCLALSALSGVVGRLHPLGALLACGLAIATVYLIGMGGLMIGWSKIAKIGGRERLLDLIAWRGDEMVLDIGCGRGLMLVGAARRLSTGRAVGIDVWRAADQSSNAPEGALENARREGVGDRVEVRTADMRALPFPDGAFDVVVSHWAVHNLDAAADRDLALSEMARVLRPGGSVILADIAHRRAYADRLSLLGLSEQRLIVSPATDAILKAVSFGAFQPAAILARRAG